MFLFYILNMFCTKIVKSLDFTESKVLTESQKFHLSSNGTLEKINNKNKSDVQLIYVYLKKQNSPYFGFINSEGKSFFVDSKNPDEVKLIDVDSELTKAALCSTGIKRDSPKCKNKNSTTDEDANEDDDKEQDSEDDKLLIFYFRPNHSKAPTIGIKGTNKCLSDFRNELNIIDCPNPGSGGPQYGWNIVFKPRDIQIEKNMNEILNLNEWDNFDKPKAHHDPKNNGDDNLKEVDKSGETNISNEMKIKDDANFEDIIITQNDPNLPANLALKQYISDLVKKLVEKENKTAKNDSEEEVLEEIVDVPDNFTPKEKRSLKRYIINQYKKFTGKKKNDKMDDTENNDDYSDKNNVNNLPGKKVLNISERFVENDFENDNLNKLNNNTNFVVNDLNGGGSIKPKNEPFYKRIHNKITKRFKSNVKKDEINSNLDSNSSNNKKVSNVSDIIQIGSELYQKISPQNNANINFGEKLANNGSNEFINPVIR